MRTGSVSPPTSSTSGPPASSCCKVIRRWPGIGRFSARSNSRCCSRIFPAISPGTIRRPSCSWPRCWRGCPMPRRSWAGSSSASIPYLVVTRAIVGRPFGWMLALAAPMVLNNALVGQNGFLTAALIGGTLYLMPVRPILAGICLGLLSYKPQYGLLFPLVLIAAAQWRTFFSAAVTTVLMFGGVVARLRHRELAGLLPLAAGVLADLPGRGQGALVETAKPVRAGSLLRRRGTTGVDAALDPDRNGCRRAGG